MKPSLSESIAAGRKAFLERMAVPYDTASQLDRYVGMLGEWNEKFNLVSANTFPDVWMRHIFDSAQLKTHIDQKARSLVDIGSGAGFPGLVLSILGVPNVHVIESIGKKAGFLKEVAKELALDVKVHHGRAEEMKNLKVDVVTARAVAPLKDLIKIARPFLKKDSVCLFLKGRTVETEMAQTGAIKKYVCERIASASDPSGSILLIRNLEPARYSPRVHRRNKT